jgi:diguanylate cyclase (GGDEF)-like protein/PAS domain S-box-containing protein
MSVTFKKLSSLLYVEDEAAAREELKEILEEFCDTLYCAENGKVGLELYKKYHPEMVISDIKMPIMNGIDMVKEIKKINKDAYIIFTTAFSDAEYMQEAISINVAGYVLKPIHLDLLEETIKKNIQFIHLENELEVKTKTIKEYLKIVDENIVTSTTDVNGIITYVSQAFCDVSGYEKEELIGKSHGVVRHEDTAIEIYDEMWQSLLTNKVWIGEFKNKKKDGSSYWVQAKMHPIYDEHNIKIGYTTIHHDITNLKKVQELSIHDALTDIYNRRHFNDIFEVYIKSAKRSNDLVCFSILDIDHFKQYNDTYGHQKGDDTLISVAGKMKEMVSRADDKLFRLGGEEFGILFKAISHQKALEFMTSIIEAISEMKIPHRSSSVSKYVTLSAGLDVEYTESIINTDTVYQKADELLYEAKESGRNRVITNKMVKND